MEPTTPSGLTRDPGGGEANDARVVHLTIPAKAEYITLCRLALTGLARVRPFSAEALNNWKVMMPTA